MAERKTNKFEMPRSSWETLKRILKAYNAVQDQESPTVESVAKLGALPRPIVSANNKFLRATGILEKDHNKLTPIGVRLATGFSLEDAGVISEALQDVIRKNQTLAPLVNALRARGTMKIKAFKAEVIVLAGLKEKSRGLAFIKTILDLLQDAQLISVTDDTVALSRGLRIDETQQIETSEVALESRPASPAKPSVQPLGHRGIHMPLPLGPNRLAYIDLPEDWKKGELPKLIKLLQLSLGDEGETESE